MIPDLRFIIGAVMATALLGATVLGLGAAMHISYQSKLSPHEPSRLLAYSSDSRPRVSVSPSRSDNPFANIPADPNPVPMQQPAAAGPEQVPSQAAADAGDPNPTPSRQEPEPSGPPSMTIAAQVKPATDPEPANAFPPADDPDTVDERAVVDPPLPTDDASASSAETNSAVAPPASTATPEPPLAAAASPIETPAPVEMPAVPIETTPAAPAPAIASPPEPTAPSSVDQVGSIPVRADSAATRSAGPTAEDMPEVSETPEPAKAKRKRAARKGPVRPARPLRRAALPSDPFNSTGYYPMPAQSTGPRPAKGFWSID